MTGDATGGDGGSALDNGTGGHGYSVALSDAVAGSTSNSLTLIQTARGGAGGGTNGDTVGTAGAAYSSLIASNEDGGDISATTTAIGGRGGSATGDADGGEGAAATAVTEVTDSGNVEAIAQATGGQGGSAFNTNRGAGAGGEAEATAEAYSSDGMARRGSRKQLAMVATAVNSPRRATVLAPFWIIPSAVSCGIAHARAGSDRRKRW